MPLPNILEFIGTNITQRKFQQAMGKLLNFTDELDKRQSATANGYYKSYATLAEANADIENIPLGVSVKVLSVEGGGEYYKATSGVTSLTKSLYDPLKMANDHTDIKFNELKETGFQELLFDKTKPRFKPLSKNVLNPKDVARDFSITSDGSISAKRNAILSGYVDVQNQQNLTVSGFLGDGVGGFRAIRFLKDDMSVITVSSIASNLTSKTFPIPNGSKYAQMTLKEANNTDINIESIQFEFSSVATAFTAYVQGELIEIYGTKLGRTQVEDLIKPKFEPANKNIFDPDNVLIGKNLNSTGAIVDRGLSITTGLIDVSKGSSIAISGLISSAYTKYCRFLDKNLSVMSVVAIDKTLLQTVLTVPFNAKYFQITLKDTTDTFVLNTKDIQIEFGNSVTTWVAYARGKAVEIYGAKILDENEVVLNKDAEKTVNTILNAKFEPGSKNIFDPTNVVLDKVVTAEGKLNDSVGAISSGFIEVPPSGNLTVSGFLGNGVGGYKAIRFLNQNGNITDIASISPSLTYKTFPIPAGSKYAQMTLKLANVNSSDPSQIQFEISDQPTDFTPYISGKLKQIYGTDLAGEGTKSKAHGASYLFFGDSITETSDVDNEVFDSTSRRVNWPVFAKDMLKMSVFRNYAKSGAAFRNRTGVTHYQYLKNQVDKAILNNEAPNVIVVACGTNDGLTNLGSYEAAMSKATLEDLDQTICLEAARWIFWTLRNTWPDAVCFYANPLQRASSTVESLEPLLDGLGKMAKRYGFILIDQNKESGIIRELEVQGGAGKYLYDGLHPNSAGSERQANLIVSKIISYMSY